MTKKEYNKINNSINTNEMSNANEITEASESNERIIAAGIRRSNDGRKTGLNRNDLIIGGSGSGKTTGYIWPNLFHPSGSFVVSDTKGQLYGKYRNSLITKGYDVAILDIVDPANSYGYNPLNYIRRNKNGSIREADIKKLATLLVPQLAKEEPFWERSATRYISMLIGYVIEAFPPQQQNLNTVIELHRACLSGSGNDMLEEWSMDHPNSYTARKYAMISGLKSTEKTYRCILEFVNESLDPFDCEEFKHVFASAEAFDIHQMGKKKTALFINSSDHDRSYHVLSCIISSQILQILIDDADQSMSGELAVPVNLFLDDFAASAKIPDFDLTLSIIRSRNISVSIILQSMSQLNSMYGRDCGTTIINNCDTILYLGGGHDLETAEFIANHTNMPVHAVLSLPKGKAILITSGEKPCQVDKIRATDEITGYTAEM
ncbi:MAG: type IV secretory system conjugative DNA transfer family protein [Clostridiales bacterium]|nr:type IV secretory system conjugative DNA transfer family protein [Clostridiales bacterium]